MVHYRKNSLFLHSQSAGLLNQCKLIITEGVLFPSSFFFLIVGFHLTEQNIILITE